MTIKTKDNVSSRADAIRNEIKLHEKSIEGLKKELENLVTTQPTVIYKNISKDSEFFTSIIQTYGSPAIVNGTAVSALPIKLRSRIIRNHITDYLQNVGFANNSKLKELMIALDSDYKFKSVTPTIYAMVDEGILIKIGRGTYKLKKELPNQENNIEELSDSLQKEYKEPSTKKDYILNYLNEDPRKEFQAVEISNHLMDVGYMGPLHNDKVLLRTLAEKNVITSVGKDIYKAR